jgi:hypothetical protein
VALKSPFIFRDVRPFQLFKGAFNGKVSQLADPLLLELLGSISIKSLKGNFSILIFFLGVVIVFLF